MNGKSELRIKYKTLRNIIVFRNKKDCKICEKVLKLIEEIKPSSVFCYVSMNSEVDTRQIISKIFGKVQVLVPHTEDDAMIAVELNSIQRLFSPDKRGNIFEKANGEGFSPSVTLVPLLAFDPNLYRLGYGGGFYDKYFEKHESLKIGLAYDEQEEFELPINEHDVPLDAIITPTRIIRRLKNEQ